MAIYDNTSEDEKLALRIHKAVKKQALSGFRDNQVIVMRIKRALFGILGDDSEVERIYKIIEKKKSCNIRNNEIKMENEQAWVKKGRKRK